MEPGQKENEHISHLDESGKARMIDIGDKEMSAREARAEAWVDMSRETFELVAGGNLPKGDVFATARIAGISAAKKTPELIPLCHNISMDSVEVDFEMDAGASRVRVASRVRATDRTGAEMEALLAAGIAALTIYDMVKAVERGVEVHSLRLTYKSGGKSGTWERPV